MNENNYHGAEHEEQGQLDEATALSLIDYVHDLVVDARALPMSASVMVNKAQMLDLLEQIREALPRDVVAADSIVNEANSVLDRASNEAQSHIDDAQVRANSILEDAEQEARTITENARTQAERVVSEARRQAEQITVDAQAQAERLVSAEEVLRVATERAHDTVRRARLQADKLTVESHEYARTQMDELVQQAMHVARVAEGGRDRIDERMHDRVDGAVDDGNDEERD